MFSLTEKIDPGRESEKLDPGRAPPDREDPGPASEETLALEKSNTTQQYRTSYEIVLSGGGVNHQGSLSTVTVGEPLRMKYEKSDDGYGLFVGDRVKSVLDRGSGRAQIQTNTHAYEVRKATHVVAA
jgi:hypothetical protein